MKRFFLLLLIFCCISCENGNETSLSESILSDYIKLNNDLELDDLIACAGGKDGGLFGVANEPTSVFFYPIEGAIDFRYYETENIKDSLDYSKYIQKELDSEPIFNGYLWKFNNLPFTGERMGIVTYRTAEKLHVCNPIRQKTTVKPTEVNSNLVDITPDGVNPKFNWEDGLIKENVIYFQIISDASNNLISGTYTLEKEFTFYDLSNVTLNITDTTAIPTLEPNKDYKFTMMGVSEDNWVNLLIEKDFSTD